MASVEGKGLSALVAVIGIRGVQRRVRCRGIIRYGIGGLASPRKRMKAVIQDEPINKLEKFIAISRRYRSHLMRRRRWLTGMFSSGTSSAARLPRLSSSAIGLIGSMRRGKKAATQFVRAAKCKGTGAVASIDVFEAEALGRYL